MASAVRKPAEEVSASFIAGALVFTVTRNNFRGGSNLCSVSTEHMIIASRKSIDKALRDLGYVKATK